MFSIQMGEQYSDDHLNTRLNLVWFTDGIWIPDHAGIRQFLTIWVPDFSGIQMPMCMIRIIYLLKILFVGYPNQSKSIRDGIDSADA